MINATEKAVQFLTVPEVAGELEMTTSGVYKLIKNGKLKAIRRSERKTFVPKPALSAYQARIRGEMPNVQLPQPEISSKTPDVFLLETGYSPMDWIAAWKADRLEDSPENMHRTILALSILADRQSELDEEVQVGVQSNAGLLK